MEWWDLYTRDRQPTGVRHLRGQPLPPDAYHLAVHVWLRGADGRYLLSQRAASRPTFPLLWECVGGAVLAGETGAQAALRETREELGLDLAGCRGGLLCTRTRDAVLGQRANSILDVWLFAYNGPPRLDRAAAGEVAQAGWHTPGEIRELWRQGRMVPTLDYFFDTVLPSRIPSGSNG